MSVQELITQIRELSIAERKQLAKAMVDLLTESTEDEETVAREFRDYRGVGANLYDGTEETYRHMPWEQFIELTYGSLADDPIERDQPLYPDVRDDQHA